MLLGGLLFFYEGSLFQMLLEFFKVFVLVGILVWVILGLVVYQSIVDIYLLVIIGWLGLVIIVINLMLVGQLDGGRIL